MNGIQSETDSWLNKMCKSALSVAWKKKKETRGEVIKYIQSQIFVLGSRPGALQREAIGGETQKNQSI